jgi:hypothetical protein
MRPGAPARSLPDVPRFSRWLLVGVAVIAGLGALSYLGSGNSCACSQTAPPLPPSPVDGVVVAVDSAALGQVKAFTLRLRDASSVTLTLGALENATEFSPSHLAEHQASSVPVRAFYRLENGAPVVYRLEDAPQ